MTNYEVDFSYKLEEYASTTVEADDKEQAEQFAREYILDTFHPCTDIAIDAVREVKTA